MDGDYGRFQAIEGEIVSDDKVAVAESSNVRISWDSAKEWLGSQTAQILFDTGQDALSGRGVVDSDVFVDVGKVLFCEREEPDGASTRRHGASCEYHARRALEVDQYRRRHAELERPRAC
jgi:hypothetical protein